MYAFPLLMAFARLPFRCHPIHQDQLFKKISTRCHGNKNGDLWPLRPNRNNGKQVKYHDNS